MNRLTLVLLLSALCWKSAAVAQCYRADYFSGTLQPGILDAPADERMVADLSTPVAVEADSAGNVYVVDRASFCIRKVDKAGQVTVFAGKSGMSGSADGMGQAARFSNPQDIARDLAGNFIVADGTSIRKVTLAGQVTTLLSTSAGYKPIRVAVGHNGNIYFASYAGAALNVLLPSGTVSYVANLAQGYYSFVYFSPGGLAVDSLGNVFAADQGTIPCIRKVTPQRTVSTYAGGGTVTGNNVRADSIKFGYLGDVELDRYGNVYVSDKSSHVIRKVTPAGRVLWVAGYGTGYADGPIVNGYFRNPTAITFDYSGNLLVAEGPNDTYFQERSNMRVRKITLGSAVVTVAGSGNGQVGGIATGTDGRAVAAMFYEPRGVAMDKAGNLYVADYRNNRIRKLLPDGSATTLAGTGSFSTDQGFPTNITTTSGYTDGPGYLARFHGPRGVAVDASGNIYVTDSANYCIRKITPDGTVSTLAGNGTSGSADGQGTAARFGSLTGICADSLGNIYVTDNGKLRKVTPGGLASTVPGVSCAGYGLAADGQGNVYFTCQNSGGKIVKVTPAGILTDVATGVGTTGGLAMDKAGNFYVTDPNNHLVRKVTPGGAISTLLGTGVRGYANGAAPLAKFNTPMGIVADTAGNLYVAERYNHTIRVLATRPPVPNAGSNSPVCANDTLRLTARTLAGVAYAWTGPGGFSSAQQNPLAQNPAGLQGGMYYVTVTDTFCHSQRSDSVAVAVYPVAVPAPSSDSPRCEGDSLHLFANAPAFAAAFQWSGPAGFSSTLQDPYRIAAVSGTGTYAVSTRTVHGCVSALVPVNVTVNPLPAQPVANDVSICKGKPATLSATATGTLSWYAAASGGTRLDTGATYQTQILTSPADYYVSTTRLGCTSPRTKVRVDVRALPALPLAGSLPACAGDTLWLLATDSTANVTYAWTGPGGFSSTDSSAAIAPAAAGMSGIYSVVAIAGGCSSLVATVQAAVNPLPSPSASNDGPVCPGTTLALDADTVPGGTYNWTGPGGFASLLQNPAVTAAASGAGWYILRVTDANGCTGTDSTLASVRVSPTATAGGPAAVCAQNPIAFTGGPGGMVSYAWTGPGGFSSPAQNPTFAAALSSQTGTYVLTVTDSLGCTDTAQVFVQVNTSVPTVAVSGPGAVCTGDTLRLTGGPAGMASYAWTGPGGFSSSLQSLSIPAATAAEEGFYALTVTSACGGGTATDSVLVTVTPTPTGTATANSHPASVAACEGDAVTLDVAGTDGVSFVWTGPGAYSAGTQSVTFPAVSLALAGDYRVSIQNADGCASASTVALEVNALPAVPLIIESGGALTTASQGTLQWLDSTGTTIPGATGAVFSPTASGSYAVRVTDTSGCSSASQPFAFVLTGLAEASSAPAGVLAYPNPFGARLSFELSRVRPDTRLRVSDLTGRTLADTSVTGWRIELDCSHWPSGFYLWTLCEPSGGVSASGRVVKQ